MGGKARAAAKKAEREADKRQARKRTEEALNSTTPTAAQTRGQSAEDTFAIVSTKKCPHVKSGIKLKKLSTAACAAFSGSPASCGESPCRSSRSSNTTLWFCLCCMRLVCQADLGSHDHPTFLHFPLASATVAVTSSSLESAITNGSVRFACTECSAELATPKNPLLLDALSAIRKRLESMSISDTHRDHGASDSRDLSPFDTTAPSAPRPHRPSGNLKPQAYLALGVHGLTNLGNTCYAASLLQVLAHTRHLGVPPAAECDDMDLLSNAFYTFLRDMHAQAGSPTLHPGALLSELGRRFREFRSFSRQNDSHEMMRCLFDVVDTEHGKRVKAARAEAEEGEDDPNTDEGDDNHNDDKDKKEGQELDEDPSPVARAFRSTLLSCIKCLACGKVQTVPEPFFDFSLVVSASLASSLAQFFAQDQVLYSCEEADCPSRQQPVDVQDTTPPAPADNAEPESGDNDAGSEDDQDDPWANDAEQDNKSEDKVAEADATPSADDPPSDTDDERPLAAPAKPSIPPTAHTKRYVIQSLAPTLCFQLKRTARLKKAKLDFPPYLSLRESDPAAVDATPSSSLPSQAHYELFGIVEHTGSMNFGHYTAYVRVHQPPLAPEARGTWAAYPVVGDDANAGGHDDDNRSAAEPVWVHANDARVTLVSEAQVLHSNPYLLFYQRVRKA